jgi:hypothetical protein
MVDIGHLTAQPRIERVRRQRQRPEAVTVIAAFKCDDAGAAGCGACQSQRDLNRVRAARGKQHPGLPTPETGCQLLAQCDRHIVAVAPRREGKAVELVLDGGDQPWVAMTNMMNRVAVQVDDAPASLILKPDAAGRTQHAKRRCRAMLVQEHGGVALSPTGQCRHR